jgi:cytochrome c oxidase subunit 2
VSSQDRTGSRRARIIPITGLAIAGALALSACTPEMKNGWLPAERNTTNETGRIIDLWVNSWIAALVVGLITWGLIIWCIIAYRRRKNATGFPRQLSYNLPLEIFYVVIPLFMVLVLFYFTDRDQRAIDANTENPDVKIDVRGKQWSWDFNYVKEDVHEDPGIQTHQTGAVGARERVPILYLPVGKRVELQLNSRDVQHSFWVPAFLQKRDLYPDARAINRYISVTPGRTGDFDGKCAELCGEFHSEMLFRVKVVSQQEYESHIAELRTRGNTGIRGDEYDRAPGQPALAQ